VAATCATRGYNNSDAVQAWNGMGSNEYENWLGSRKKQKRTLMGKKSKIPMFSWTGLSDSICHIQER